MVSGIGLLAFNASCGFWDAGGITFLLPVIINIEDIYIENKETDNIVLFLHCIHRCTLSHSLVTTGYSWVGPQSSQT